MDLLVFIAGFALITLASKQMGTSLRKTGLPMISAFLLTGIISGPYVLGMITKEAVETLGFVDKISLGFIAFSAGVELYLKELRSKLQRIAWITAGLVTFTFSLTAITLYLISAHIPFMAEMPPSTKAAVAILATGYLVLVLSAGIRQYTHDRFLWKSCLNRCWYAWWPVFSCPIHRGSGPNF